MKKLFVAATLGLALVACGGKDEDTEKTQTSDKSENSGKTENTAPTVCDCVKWGEQYRKESRAADGKEARYTVKANWKDRMDQCNKLGEGKSEEELKAMREEAKNCK